MSAAILISSSQHRHVVVQIARQMAGDALVSQHMATAPVLTGLMAGFGVMYGSSAATISIGVESRSAFGSTTNAP